MSQKKLSGTGVALATPFNTEGKVDYTSLEKLTNHVITGGVDYLVVLGTTGETSVLSSVEKKEILKFVKGCNSGRLPIVLGIGGNYTQAVVDEIKNTDFNGIDAVLSVAPYYNKPSQEGLYQHFSHIANASPIPVIIYNVPGRTSSNISAETCLRLANDFPGKIIAVKEASGNLPQVMNIIKDKPKDFMVISGDDALTFSIINLGGEGVISVTANAYPSEFSSMVNYSLNNETDKARELHYKLLPAIDLMFAEGSPAGVKAFMNVMGLMENVLRLPLVPVSENLYRRIAAII